MNNKADNQGNGIKSIGKAMDVCRIWMQALTGKISKRELGENGIRFIAVTE